MFFKKKVMGAFQIQKKYDIYRQLNMVFFFAEESVFSGNEKLFNLVSLLILLYQNQFFSKFKIRKLRIFLINSMKFGQLMWSKFLTY